MEFHESTVVELSSAERAVRVVLDDVRLDGGKVVGRVEIRFFGVSSMFVDGTAASKIDMDFPDGEVLTFMLGETECELIVEWNDFQNHTNKTQVYVLNYEGYKAEEVTVDDITRTGTLEDRRR